LNNRYRPAPGRAVALPMPDSNLAIIPEPSAHQGMGVTQVVAMLRARWKPIVIISISIIVLAALAIKSLPKTYTATATLLVSSDVKDPLAGADFPAGMVANYVSTQIEILTSPIVLLPAVDRLRLTEDRNFTAGFSGSSDALREFAAKNLALSLQVERGTGGQLIFVSASSKNAARAAVIANAVADVYLEQDRRQLEGPASERAKRYVEELAELRDKVSAAQEKVTVFRKQNGIDDITAAAGETEVQTLGNLQARLLETQNLRRSLEARQPGQSAANASPAVGAVQALKSQLETQLAQLGKLQGTYGPQHPKIRELEGQIAATRQSIVDESRSISEDNQTDLARTKELEQKYVRAVAEQGAKVENLRQAQDKGSKLLLELDSAQSVYKHALDGFDQIMFQAVANHTNVNIVSRAVPPLKASKPNKPKLMLVALAAALGLGFGVPLGYELFFDRRLRCRDDMEREFGITVLAQLEAVPALIRAT
jgi:polysaccharide biosynthesis transport protein